VRLVDFVTCYIAGKTISEHFQLCVYRDFSIGNVNKGAVIRIFYRI